MPATEKVLIIGQGISGTWLSFWLYSRGIPFTVLDAGRSMTSSRVASGVINPVTGRQVITTWKADVLLPFAEVAYRRLGDLLDAELIRGCGILTFPPSQDMAEAYRCHMQQEAGSYLHEPPDAENWSEWFRFRNGVFRIAPAYHIDLLAMLGGWRAFLTGQGLLREEIFDESRLELHGHSAMYAGESFGLVVYADGMASAQSRWWQALPWSLNKGDALIVSIPGLPAGQIYKFGITTLVPWHDGLWWAGSSYDNRFADSQPTAAFRARMEAFLGETLLTPWEVTGHLAAIRPATLERRPFVGLHPGHPHLAILNGMGTKGVSLAPWLSQQLVHRWLGEGGIEPAADIARFRRAFLQR